MNERRTHNLVAIKGPDPEGAAYSDGDPITAKVSVAWQDCLTGDVFYIKYER